MLIGVGERDIAAASEPICIHVLSIFRTVLIGVTWPRNDLVGQCSEESERT